MSNKDNIILIMAGGEGKRMNSDLPKVLHLLNNKPMIVHVLEKALSINPKQIFIIVGKHKDLIINTIKKYISFYDDKIIYIHQEQSLGTGHAIMCSIPYVKTFCKKNYLKYEKIINKDSYNKTRVLILSADVPLITVDTINIMLNTIHENNLVRNASLLTLVTENNYGYGRIVEKDGEFIKIVEEKDCNEIEKKIKTINCGIYSFDCEVLCKYINLLDKNNSQEEYYLTDIFKIIKERNTNNNSFMNVNSIKLNSSQYIEVVGVNTKEQLEKLETECILK